LEKESREMKRGRTGRKNIVKRMRKEKEEESYV
jgi:hypothetical protein